MRGVTRALLLTGVVALAAVGCTRRVVVESEPARSQAATQLDLGGVYDYRVDFQGDVITGEMNVSRVGSGYAVALTSSAGDARASNVRRQGDTLLMDLQTPGGPATAEMTWRSRDEVRGLIFLGGTAHDFRAIRRR